MKIQTTIVILRIITLIILAIILHFVSASLGQSEYSIERGYRSITDIHKEKTYFSFIYGILLCLVYILIISALSHLAGLDCLLKDIYLISIFYFIFRIILIALILQRWKILNKFEFFSQAIISILLSFILYKGYVEKNIDNLLKFPDDIVAQLWIITFVFIIGVINKIKDKNYDFPTSIANYTQKQYIYFKSKFDNLLKSLGKKEQNIILAIMIYENFQRPKFVRIIENTLHRLNNASSTGIMQIQNTKKIFSDENSVSFVIEKLRKLPEEKRTLEYLVRNIYNQTDEYLDEVNHIYGQLENIST